MLSEFIKSYLLVIISLPLLILSLNILFICGSIMYDWIKYRG